MVSPVAKSKQNALQWEPGVTPFEKVVAAYQRELYATAVRILRDRPLAEDVLQDAFVKAYRAIDNLPSGSNLRAWLYRILVNTAYDQIDRLKSRTKAMDDLRDQERADPRVVEPPSDPKDVDIPAQVEAAIRELPQKFRDPLLLRHIQGLSYAEVGEALSIPEPSARTLVFRGKKLLVPKLKHLLE